MTRGVLFRCVAANLGKCGSRMGSVESLRFVGGLVAEGCGRGDPVSVTVGGDDCDVAEPDLLIPYGARRWAESPHPWCPVSHGIFGQGAGARFDQVAALVERNAHVVSHRSDGFGDESGDEARRPALAPAGWILCGEAEPVPQDGGRVVGVLKGLPGDELGKQMVDLMVVSFGVPQLGGQGPEGIGLDHRISLLRTETAGADECDPAVVLGAAGDGLVLGTELCDRRPNFLLDLDALVGGEFNPGVLEHCEHDCAGVHLVWVWGGVTVVGLVERDVGMFASRPRVIETWRFSRVVDPDTTTCAVSTVMPWAR
jgi:hypothetical protein